MIDGVPEQPVSAAELVEKLLKEVNDKRAALSRQKCIVAERESTMGGSMMLGLLSILKHYVHNMKRIRETYGQAPVMGQFEILHYTLCGIANYSSPMTNKMSKVSDSANALAVQLSDYTEGNCLTCDFDKKAAAFNLKALAKKIERMEKVLMQ
jgi:hypothetical protein